MPVASALNPDRDFTLTHYREILRAIRSAHKLFSFKDAQALGRSILHEPRFCIMRHDIEFSLYWALRIAEIDHQEGARSTFFLLQTSEYNPFEREQALMVRKILELGHDIGLHYDAALFEELGLDALKVAQKQIELFETFFDTRIYAMSSHMPMRSGKTFSVPGVVDTYDPLYLVDIKYITDSTQAWRNGVVTRWLADYPRIHLLTHEYVWHELGTNWDANLLLQLKDDADAAWRRTVERLALFREGLALRAEKDRTFQRRFMVAETCRGAGGAQPEKIG